MRKTIFLIIIFALSLNLLAIFNDYEPSPRARAMGGAYYSLSNDPMAVFYNPAGLSLAGNGVATSYSQLFGNNFQELTVLGFSYELPYRLGTFGLGLQSMDVDYLEVNLMSEKIYNLSHSFTLLKDIHSEIYLGYSLNMYSLDMDSFGSETDLGINLGALAILHQRTRLAFTVSNLNNPAFGKEDDEELAQKMAIGIAYEPYPDVVTAIEMKKTYGLGGVEGEKTELHTGMEFKINELLTLRAGLRTQPVSYSAGAGIHAYGVQIDYGYNTHAVLSGTHHIGLSYKF
ncbi:MAG: hypothetical protein K9M99_06515 [Candidatus Cloacimonetes bacterium]|nr:hypothetical protein [Candidatus Cloacimonadota bacterium]